MDPTRRMLNSLSFLYRAFNYKAKPSFILSFQVEGAIEQNLSPDKRFVLLPNEGELTECLKAEMESILKNANTKFYENSALLSR